MEFIKSYITSLTVYVFIITIIQNLLPASKTKTAVCSVLSIILTAVTVTPVLKINTQNHDISEYIDEYTLSDTSLEDIKSKQTDSTKTIVCNAIKRQTAYILKKYNLSETSQVEIDDSYCIISITVDEISPEASKEISEFFSIPETSVKLRR